MAIAPTSSLTVLLLVSERSLLVSERILLVSERSRTAPLPLTKD